MEKQCEIPGCVMQDFLFCEMLEKNENWNLSKLQQCAEANLNTKIATCFIETANQY